MLYLLVKTEDVLSLEYVLDIAKVEKVETDNILNPLYSVVLITGEYTFKAIQDILLENSIKAKAITPYLSKESFIQLFSEKVYDNLNLDLIHREYSLFEAIICNHQKIYPHFDTEYILLVEILPIDKRTYLRGIRDFNITLDEYNLLIDEDKVRARFGALLKNAIYKVLEVEANNEEIRIIDIKKSNKNFKDNAMAEFILSATAIYPKDEIRDFLIENFQDEMSDV